MPSLSYEFEHNVPVFRCDYCGQCEQHIEARNDLLVNRGCCWYFPVYELIDIKNILDGGHENFIRALLAAPQSQVSGYQIKVGGRFEKELYAQYLRICPDAPRSDFDESLRFRLCSLFGSSGCSIPARLRPHPCNLYLCREVVDWAGPDYHLYQQERKDYFAYCAYVNNILRDELLDHGVDLLTGMDDALSVIAACAIPEFQPRPLSPIILNTPPRPLSA